MQPLAALDSPAPGAAIDEDEGRDALGIPRGVRGRHRRGLRHTEQRRPLHAGGIEDRAQVGDEVLEGDGGRVPVGEAVAASVVPDEAAAAAEQLEPVRPDRTLPVDLEMAQPVGRLDQRRSIAEEGIGQPRAVVGLGEVNALRLSRGAGCRRCIRADLVDLRHQAIALSAHGLNFDARSTGQGPANVGDVVLKVVLLDDHVRPEPIDQPFLFLERPGAFDEKPQRVERLAGQGDGLAVAQQTPFPDVETKGPKRIHPGCVALVHAPGEIYHAPGWRTRNPTVLRGFVDNLPKPTITTGETRPGAVGCGHWGPYEIDRSGRGAFDLRA